MKAKKVLLATAVAATVALGAAACSSSGSSSSSSGSGPDFSAKPSSTLTISGFNPTDDVGTSRTSYAEKKLKSDGVSTVTLNKAAFSAQKFTAQVASGNVPDLLYMQTTEAATYAAKGLITPVNKCFASKGIDAASQYYSSVLDQVSYKGKYYGLPEFWQTAGIMLNKKLMDAAGVTSADFSLADPQKIVDAAKKMYKAEGGKPTVMGFDPSVSGGNISTWMLAFGGGTVDKSGKPILNSAANVKALTWLKQVYDAQGGYAKASSFINTFDFFGNDNQFVKNQVGSELVQQWYPAVLAPEASKLDITAVPVTNTSGKPIGISLGNVWAIPTKAKNPAAACDFAAAMTSNAAWTVATKARLATVAKTKGSIFTGLFTGSKTADAEITGKYLKSSGNTGFDQTIQAFNETLKNPVSMGSSPAGAQITNDLNSVVSPAMTGSQSIKAALDSAQSAAMKDYQSATSGS